MTALPRFQRYFPALVLLLAGPIRAQMITGTWQGRINRQKVEVKIIQKGDSLTGTSYYYESGNNYRRYSISGYFDAVTNEAVWWDDRLIEERSGRLSISSPGKIPLLARADFNCPGGGRMMLDGKATKREDTEGPSGPVHLDKTGRAVFEDEWDYVIDNYTAGTNDPDLIDSIGFLAFGPKPIESPAPAPPVREKSPPPVKKTVSPPVVKKDPPPAPKKETIMVPDPVPLPPTITEKFTARTRMLVKEIPLTGDSIELRFYDNAEIDGDSISLFINNMLLNEHIRLSANAWIIKLPVATLADSTEITMVAENLGSIPPNTAYMVAMVGETRYDALLASTEGSSAMIRLIKPK